MGTLQAFAEVLGAGLGLGRALPVTARAETESFQVSETTPLAMASVNPCTGEPVTLSGTYHVTSNYRVTADESGTKFHSVESKKFSLSGTGALCGARYQNEQHEFNEQNGQFTFDTGGVAPYEQTNVTNVRLIRQGETVTGQDDFYVQFVSHVTYTATGAPKCSGGTLNIFCR